MSTGTQLVAPRNGALAPAGRPTARPSGLAGRALAVLDAAVTPHGIDRYLELVDPLWSSREIRARVVRVARPTPRAVTLTLRPNRLWRGFTAGQHTQLTVEIDGVRHTRCYSVAVSEHDRSGTIELTVKAHPDGLVSGHLVAHAHEGMVVGLSPAGGEFTLPLPRPRDLLLISGGSGITPVLSMLRTLSDEGHDGRVTFLHYALRADDLLYGEVLDALADRHPNVRVVRVLTDEPGAGDLDGLLTPAQLDLAHPGWADADAYVCGPAPLMDAARDAYAGAGRSERLRSEAFTIPRFVGAAGPGGAPAGGTVRFAATGTDVADDGRPLLVQAEDAGLRPASGCRMGICHTCTRTLRSGAVRDVVTGRLAQGPDTPVRICVSAPVGDVEIDL